MIPDIQTISKARSWGKLSLATSPTLAIANPGLEAEVILAHLLGEKREYLFSHPEAYLSVETQSAYIKAIEERLSGRPVSQLVEAKEFYSRKFFVNDQVLTPRPETETLIEVILQMLKSRRPVKQPLKIADIGTGSGCIAITLACELSALKIPFHILAADVSPSALRIAQKNRDILLTEKCQDLEFQQLDILKESLPGDFDIIVSNPPYIPAADLKELPPDVRDFEPHLALDGGADGLKFYRRLNTLTLKHLKKRGLAVFELHAPLAEQIRAIFADKYDPEIILDLSKRPRVLLLENLQL